MLTIAVTHNGCGFDLALEEITAAGAVERSWRIGSYADPVSADRGREILGSSLQTFGVTAPLDEATAEILRGIVRSRLIVRSLQAKDQAAGFVADTAPIG